MSALTAYDVMALKNGCASQMTASCSPFSCPSAKPFSPEAFGLVAGSPLCRTDRSTNLSDSVLQALKKGDCERHDPEAVQTDSSSSSLRSSASDFSLEDMGEDSQETMKDSGKKRVSFAEEVNVREYCSSDSSAAENDFVIRLKKGDFSRPVIEAVKLSPEEQAIRSKLVGCIRAEKRIRPDFGRMYGCGKRMRFDDDDDEEYDSYEDPDDEEALADKPIRTIQAHAPSACWFTPVF